MLRLIFQAVCRSFMLIRGVNCYTRPSSLLCHVVGCAETLYGVEKAGSRLELRNRDDRISL